MVKTTQSNGSGTPGESSYDAMLMRAMEQGDDSLQTGRQIVTFNPEGGQEARSALESLNLRVADARDFSEQQFSVEDVGDADAVVLPEIGIAIVNAADAAERANVFVEDASSPIEAVEPEYFAFSDDVSTDFLRGFRKATEAIANGSGGAEVDELGDDEVEAEAFGATWGLVATRVPWSSRTGQGVRVAVLDTGMALNHPDFAGRPIVGGSFVGQPVMDLHGHGTHCIGTACGPMSPPGLTPRYGIGHRVAPIFAGKVLSNSGSGGTGSVLAGMNWAIANNCAVISMSLGSQSPVQFAYTAVGRIALLRGCLIIAAAGNAHSQTGAPANSPTIMAVASLDRNLVPSSFSNFGKIEIAAPGRDVFSAAPMPRRYAIMSGTSMATPHVAGCAALWAQTSPALRGQALWNRLVGTARPLPFPVARVGRGLVQAPA
jgi:subtilisin